MIFFSFEMISIKKEFSSIDTVTYLCLFITNESWLHSYCQDFVNNIRVPRLSIFFKSFFQSFSSISIVQSNCNVVAIDKVSFYLRNQNKNN